MKGSSGRTLALGLVLSACGGEGKVGTAPTGMERPVFRWCVGRELTPAPRATFRHTDNLVLSLASDPNHSAEDAISASSGSASLVARLSYGLLAIDLPDEDVRVFIDDCRGYRSLGDHATDEDGRVSVTAPADLGPGAYEVRFQVLGDQTTTASYLWVLPEQTRLVVTDIDGTLTASDSELFMQVLDGSHTPVAYPGAVDLTARHAELGSVIVYLTGRPYWLTQKTREWTSGLGFAPGPLHVAATEAEALPGESGVGDYKLDWLEGLLTAGYPVDFAYGNASTDVYAYLGAGFDPSVVWIIGENAGAEGTNGAVDSWEPRLAELGSLPAVEQPFDWR